MRINAVGIDFGTTNILVGFCKDGKSVEFVPINNKEIIPSVINYHDGKIRFGEHIDKHDIKSIKRKIGSTKLVHNKPVADICCDMFEQIKKVLDEKFGEELYKCIVTVPAYFNDIQRNLVRAAASAAGLDVLMIFNEPTAALLSYKKLSEGYYLVYDFGGGTFDASVILYKEGVFQVLGTSGDTELGGDDIDAEIAKKLNITLDDAKAIKESGKITKEIREIYDSFADETINICSKLMKSLNARLDKLDRILMVGGSSRIKTMRKRVEDFFGIKPELTDPDTAVGKGAAIKSYHLINKTNHIMVDVVPLTIGIEMFGGGVDPVIKRNSRIPCRRTSVYTTANDRQEYMNLNIVQGESHKASECTSIGRIKMKIVRNPAIPTIRFTVEFKIDIEGILKVRASQLGAGEAQEIIINPHYGLTKGKVMKAIQEIYDDPSQALKARMEEKMIKNAMELANSVEGALKEDGDLATDEEKEKIYAKIEHIRSHYRDIPKLLASCHELETLAQDFAARRIRRILNMDAKG